MNTDDIFFFFSFSVKGKQSVVCGVARLTVGIFKIDGVTAYLNADEEKDKREVKINHAGEIIIGVIYPSTQEGIGASAKVIQ